MVPPGPVFCGVVWCAEGAVTRRQWPGCLPTGTGKRAGLCVWCALCVSVLLHSRTSALLIWLALLCRRLCAVTQGPIGPLHAACRAAPSMPPVWGRTAWCCALHCTVCALLHRCCRQRAVGRETHCHAACGLWAVEILLRTATLPEGSGEWYSCRTLPLCLGAVDRASPAIHCLPAWGSGQWSSCDILPHCLGAMGSATPATHFLTAWGQWAVELLPYTASLPGGSGQWNPGNTLPHCLGAPGSGTAAVYCLIAWGQWGLGLLHYTASLPGGSGQRNSCNALPHCLGRWVVELRQSTASLPRCSGEWNSCNALPHWLGAMGSGSPATHCPTA